MKPRVVLMVLATSGWFSPAAVAETGSWLDVAQARVVKIYGAGGLRGLEGQQTGLVVSESGRVLTIDSAVLETGEATVVLAGGDRYNGRVVAIDRTTDLALLEIEAEQGVLQAFDLVDPPEPAPGEPIWALSNAFGIAAGDEPVTVQRGIVAAIGPLAAKGPRRAPPGVDRVVVTDAITSNPGAAGGALIDSTGRLVGMIGRETRSRVTGGWLNHALPSDLLARALKRMGEAGGETRTESTPIDRFEAREEALSTGVVFITPLTPLTPAYVEHVVHGSPAEAAGLRADDLVVAVNGVSVAASADAPRRLAETLAASGSVELSVLRGDRIVTLRIETGGAP